jgi:hypothetical protein
VEHEPYPITNRWQANDTYLDWYGHEEFQVYQRRGPSNEHEHGLAPGTPLDWTTNDQMSANAVVRNGFGFLKENFDAALGPNYWMLDVDMDCESAVTIGSDAWFEFKSYLTNASASETWEPNIIQSDGPYASTNHFGKCGRINIFERGTGSVIYRDFDTAEQCSFPGTERRCNGSHAQVCGVAKIWENAKDCVLSNELCQVSTGTCCRPETGKDTNQNCF